jgi:flagellar hook-associated protein FlgK
VYSALGKKNRTITLEGRTGNRRIYIQGNGALRAATSRIYDNFVNRHIVRQKNGKAVLDTYAGHLRYLLQRVRTSEELPIIFS